jgi:hypothetical protein
MTTQMELLLREAMLKWRQAALSCELHFLQIFLTLYYIILYCYVMLLYFVILCYIILIYFNYTSCIEKLTDKIMHTITRTLIVHSVHTTDATLPAR